MDKKKLQELGDKIAKSNFFEKYGYKHHWTSGCATNVAPIRIFVEDNCIEIQLGLRNLRGINRSFDKLVNELGEQGTKHYICKYDGSCPDVAKIYFD